MTSLIVLLASLSLGAPAPVPRGAAPVADGDDVFVMEVKAFFIPLHVRADRAEEVFEVRLHVSDDQGKTWRVAQAVTPGAKAFSFVAPREGLYWFRVQVVSKAGTNEPGEIKGATADQKVRIKLQPARVAATTPVP